MIRLSLFFFFTLVSQLPAQSLQGVVTLANSGKKPLAGVQIFARNASPTLSLDNGGFNLVFIKHLAGSKVVLSAEKEGFEVVNARELATIISNSKYDTLKIFMCPIGEIDRRRAVYYEVNTKKITQRYEQEIAALRKENRSDFAEKSKKLTQDFEAAQQQIQQLSDRFAMTNLDECSLLYRKAAEFFEQGELDKAIETLDEDVLEDILRKAEEEIQLANELDSIAKMKYEHGLDAKLEIEQFQNLRLRSEMAFQEKVKKLLTEEYADQYELRQAAEFSFDRADWPIAAALFEKTMRLDLAPNSAMLEKLLTTYKNLGDTENYERIQRMKGSKN